MSHFNYKTKQRESVLNYIISQKNNHVTVNQICDHLSRSGTPVGVATVYRHLEHLVEEGLVQKYVLDNSSGACFQYVDRNENCTRHFHLKCERCSRLIHLECSRFEDLFRHISDEHRFAVDPFRTVIYGICADCQKQSMEDEQ